MQKMQVHNTVLKQQTKDMDNSAVQTSGRLPVNEQIEKLKQEHDEAMRKIKQKLANAESAKSKL